MAQFQYAPAAAQIGNASTTDAGLMSASDKTKLNGIAEGATANVGTVTGITMNNTAQTVDANGVVNLGTVLTQNPLPAVTSSDNGKFLTVVSGAWAATTVPNANGVGF